VRLEKAEVSELRTDAEGKRRELLPIYACRACMISFKNLSLIQKAYR
jgi:hypothetical protein